jgi:hypothetical protein
MYTSRSQACLTEVQKMLADPQLTQSEKALLLKLFINMLGAVTTQMHDDVEAAYNSAEDTPIHDLSIFSVS